MTEVIVRAEARADMLDIYAHSVEQFGEDAARGYIGGIDRAIARLAEFPEIGPVYPGVRPPVRYLAYRRHHIVYDYDGVTVWIARIVHHARDFRRMI